MIERKLTAEQKILGGKLWEELHRKKYELTMTERAEAIKKYIESTHQTPTQVADELNVSKKEVYRTLTILRCPEDVKPLIKEGLIGDDKVSRVIYNLKDKSDESITRAVLQIIKSQKTNTTQVEEQVSELNDQRKIADHYRQELRKIHAIICELEPKIPILDVKSLRMIEIDNNQLTSSLSDLTNKVLKQKTVIEQSKKPKKVVKK